LNLTGHKDEEIARPLAEHLARCLDRVVVVTGGYHLDGADRAQIRAVEGNARLLGSMLAAALSRADRNPGGQ
jgi:metal-dependent hydrolase (beta-lactamase superfamily II)